MKKKKREGRSSKDFCNLWRQLYTKKYNKPFHIKWMLDGSAFKRLMATYSNVVIIKLIRFVFDDNSSITSFLRSTGYSIVVFERGINGYQQHMDSGGVNKEKLDLDVPYWDDKRFSFMANCVRKDDLSILVRNIPYDNDADETWKLLVETVRKQNISFFYKVKLYYTWWKRSSSVKRKAIKRCHLK